MKQNFSIYAILFLLMFTLFSCTNSNPFVEGQKWEGKYICELEEYDLDFEIIEVQDNVVKALISESVKMYFGSFIVIGEYNCKSSQIEFKAMDWVPDQKARFRNAMMVDFKAYILNDPPRLEGQLNYENEDCFGFKVQLVE